MEGVLVCQALCGVRGEAGDLSRYGEKTGCLDGDVTYAVNGFIQVGDELQLTGGCCETQRDEERSHCLVEAVRLGGGINKDAALAIQIK